MANATVVLAVFWLSSGSPAWDYMDAEQCAAIETMTRRSGFVQLELADGSKLTATRMECRPIAVLDCP